MSVALPEYDNPRQLWPTLLRLAAPVSMQMVVASSLGFVDVIMVSALGPAALGGVGLINRWFFVIILALAGLSSGIGILVAQAAGAGRADATRGLVGAGIILGLLLTLPLAVAAAALAPNLASWLTPDPGVRHQAALFLRWSAATGPLMAITMTLGAAVRSRGDTRTPMWASIVALGLNTLLNFLFIQGRFGLPAGGVIAAALATTVGRSVEVLWLLLVYGRRTLARPTAAELSTVAYTGGTLALNESLWASGMFAYQIIISYMGRIPLAVSSLITPIDGTLVSIFLGGMVATGIMLGQTLGRGDFNTAFLSARRLLIGQSLLALAVGVLLAVLCQLLRQIGLPNRWLAADLQAVFFNSLSVLGLGFALKVHNMIAAASVLRAGNDTRFVLAVDVGVLWLVGVPLVAAVALYRHWSLPAVTAAIFVEEAIKTTIWRWRINRRHWLASRAPEVSPNP